ncbi:hypothetical protein OESDEN_04114 [Oesophagostomum dentatum]|uniref:Uncharacterized protein n=1 Tax=Oesophagostomum dentatum TaxID=61180 RepID=A0A0B1TF88_OESDE|nr:hypothetical protein OESDEN_04114 [Oesophagostomum dentatum]
MYSSADVLGTSTRAFVPRNAGNFPGYDYFHHLKKSSPFYCSFIISTSAEWAMTLLMFVFILSLTAELRHSYICAPRVIFRRSNDDTSTKRSVAVVDVNHSVVSL